MFVWENSFVWGNSYLPIKSGKPAGAVPAFLKGLRFAHNFCEREVMFFESFQINFSHWHGGMPAAACLAQVIQY